MSSDHNIKEINIIRSTPLITPNGPTVEENMTLTTNVANAIKTTKAKRLDTPGYKERFCTSKLGKSWDPVKFFSKKDITKLQKNRDEVIDLINNNEKKFSKALKDDTNIQNKFKTLAIAIRDGKAVNFLQELGIDKETWNDFPDILKDIL